jgi:hypothetical protein
MTPEARADRRRPLVPRGAHHETTDRSFVSTTNGFSGGPKRLAAATTTVGRHGDPDENKAVDQ